jgi:hypothetical protein
MEKEVLKRASWEMHGYGILNIPYSMGIDNIYR